MTAAVPNGEHGGSDLIRVCPFLSTSERKTYVRSSRCDHGQ